MRKIHIPRGKIPLKEKKFTLLSVETMELHPVLTKYNHEKTIKIVILRLKGTGTESEYYLTKDWTENVEKYYKSHLGKEFNRIRNPKLVLE